MDVLSEVLDICRSERAVTARFALTAPWSLKSTGVTGAMIRMARGAPYWIQVEGMQPLRVEPGDLDRKSTRLNSSHSQISYAVFCLKKKKKNSDRKSSAHRLE